ncbi:MAG: PEP-CTERM sorting domain-containing protein [Sulfuricella sp.]
MKKHLLAVCLLGFSAVSNATVLTFDDIPGASQNSYGAIGTYAGFNFGATNDLNRMDWIDTAGSSWNFGAVSGDFTMLNNYGGTAIVTAANGADFAFDGLWARIWSTGASRIGYIRGFNNGAEVWNSAATLTTSWTAFNGHAGSIDELHLELGNYYLVDNLAVNETIPEPATLGLLALGFLGMRLARRKA